jgi:5-methylcytosine-specific restriction endonuclease McrA
MRKKLKDLETSSTSGTQQKPERLYNCGEWTPSRFRSFVTSALRTATRRWPPKFKVLKEANVGRKLNKATNKQALHYQCAHCKKHFIAKDIQVDHIFPVVSPTDGFISWDVYIDRMFCEKNNLQVLCKTCHSVKTSLEKEERKHGKAKKR